MLDVRYFIFRYLAHVIRFFLFTTSFFTEPVFTQIYTVLDRIHFIMQQTISLLKKKERVTFARYILFYRKKKV